MIGMIKPNIGDQLWFVGSGDHDPIRVRVIESYGNFIGDLYVQLEDDLQSTMKFIKAGQTMGVNCKDVRWPTG